MHYRCNICGKQNFTPRENLGRETADCTGCGSTLRMRAVIGLLSRGLFGKFLAIDDFPRRKDIRGIGLSDWDQYARRLERRLGYTNTFYHQAPRLDITDIPDESVASCDFLISSDVFEHVEPPIHRAFAGARRLLKPGGLLVLTVPYVLEGNETIEHFPHLHEWSLAEGEDGRPLLNNRRRDGLTEQFDELAFHGGPGTTLEMRIFSRESLLAELDAAGFVEVEIADQPMPEIGVHWPLTWSLPVVARA
jgi:SAM-dependent methyltransferase